MKLLCGFAWHLRAIAAAGLTAGDRSLVSTACALTVTCVLAGGCTALAACLLAAACASSSAVGLTGIQKPCCVVKPVPVPCDLRTQLCSHHSMPSAGHPWPQRIYSLHEASTEQAETTTRTATAQACLL